MVGRHVFAYSSGQYQVCFFAAFPIKRVWMGIRYCLKLHLDIEKGSITEFFNMLSSFYESDKFTTNSILIDWMFQIILQWGSGKWRTFIITMVGYKTRLVTCLLSLFSNSHSFSCVCWDTEPELRAKSVEFGEGSWRIILSMWCEDLLDFLRAKRETNYLNCLAWK